MFGIKWKDGIIVTADAAFREYSDGLVCIHPSSIKVDDIVFGYDADEMVFGNFIKTTRGKIISTCCYDEVKHFIEVDKDGFLEFAGFVRKVYNEYLKLLDEFNPNSEWFVIRIFDDGFDVLPKVYTAGGLPVEIDIDDYLAEYNRVVKMAYEYWKDVVRSLEEEFDIGIVFV